MMFLFLFLFLFFKYKGICIIVRQWKISKLIYMLFYVNENKYSQEIEGCNQDGLAVFFKYYIIF